jgi:hypothetical protein
VKLAFQVAWSKKKHRGRSRTNSCGEVSHRPTRWIVLGHSGPTHNCDSRDSAAAPSQNDCLHNPSRHRLGINDHEAPTTSIIEYIVASHHRRPPTQTSIIQSPYALTCICKDDPRLQAPLQPSCSGLEVRYLQFSHFALTSRFSSAVAEIQIVAS